MSLSGPELPAKSRKDKTEGCTQLPSKTLHSFFIDSNNPYRYREVASEKLCSVQKGSSLQAQGVRKVLAN